MISGVVVDCQMHRIIYSFNYTGEQQITAGLTAGDNGLLFLSLSVPEPKGFSSGLKIVMRRTRTQHYSRDSSSSFGVPIHVLIKLKASLGS